jgi:hypothetical protein
MFTDMSMQFATRDTSLVDAKTLVSQWLAVGPTTAEGFAMLAATLAGRHGVEGQR